MSANCTNFDAMLIFKFRLIMSSANIRCREEFKNMNCNNVVSLPQCDSTTSIRTIINQNKVNKVAYENSVFRLNKFKYLSGYL